VISLATFPTAGLVAAYFVRRVHHNLGKAGAPLHLNPFL